MAILLCRIICLIFTIKCQIKGTFSRLLTCNPITKPKYKQESTSYLSYKNIRLFEFIRFSGIFLLYTKHNVALGKWGLKLWGNDFPCRQQNQTKPYQTKSPIFSEKYWYYFRCPKNVLCSILSFVFWIFPPLDTAVQLESADSKQNTISKSLFQDSFPHFFWAMLKIHHTFWKKRPLELFGVSKIKLQFERWAIFMATVFGLENP